MALTAVTEGATSTVNDLNQIVNLLNGTTTNTQATLRGGFSSDLAGAPSRFIGGANAVHAQSFNPGTPVEPVDGTYHLSQGDVTVLPGGPFAIGANPVGSFALLGGVTPGAIPGIWNPTGGGGYVARMHLAGTVNLTSGSQFVTMDTIDFDPRGMVQPFAGPGGGLAITAPNNGAFAFVGSIRGKGVNSANCGFSLSWYNPAAGAIGSSVVCSATARQSPGTSTDYTGGSAAYVIFASKGMQLCFTPAANPRATFQIDNTDSTRTYIAAWVPN